MSEFGKDINAHSRKGVFIPDITVEMLRNAPLEGVEDLMASGEMEDISLPSAQPERKRGRWIYGEDNLGTGRDGWFCSECGHFELWDYSADMKSAELNLPNYCPNCGADMRGAQE